MSYCIREKTVITRKPHRCFGCGRRIKPGTKTLCTVDVDGGEVFNCYFCDTCVEVIRNMEYPDEFFEGDLEEDARELEEAKKQ